MKSDVSTSNDQATQLRSCVLNLQSWHGFNGDLFDQQGDRHVECVVGNVTFGPDRFGNPRGSLVLHGSSGLVFREVPINDRSFSVQFWAFNPQKWILAQGVGEDGHGLHIGVGSTGMRCDYWGNDLIAPLGSNTVWSHWVMTYDFDQHLKSTWRDGVCVAQMRSTPYSGVGAFTLGRHFSGIGFYSGSLDDLAIWDRTLTAAEVAFLYVKGMGLDYPGLALK